METRGVVHSTGFEVTPPVFAKFIIPACCSSLGRESGSSTQRLQTGGSWRLMPPVCTFPDRSRYEGGIKGTCNVSESLAKIDKEPHTADKAREASPMPPAPAESNRILFSEDDLATGPANAEIIRPPPAVNTNDARITADCVARLFKASPAQGTGIAFFFRTGLAPGVVSLQGNDSRNGMSVGTLTGL
jgi:hypothetical protein